MVPLYLSCLQVMISEMSSLIISSEKGSSFTLYQKYSAPLVPETNVPALLIYTLSQLSALVATMKVKPIFSQSYSISMYFITLLFQLTFSSHMSIFSHHNENFSSQLYLYPVCSLLPFPFPLSPLRAAFTYHSNDKSPQITKGLNNALNRA